MTVSSFGKDVADVRTKVTYGRNVLTTVPGTSIIIEPLTSNNRKAMATLMRNVGNACRRISMAKPVKRGIRTACKMLRSSATIVRVTRTSKVALIRNGPSP